MRMRRIAASLLAVLFLSRILSGCAGTPEIRERELPADRERLEQCLKELDLGFVVGGTLTVVNSGSGNLIVNVKETRIAITKEMAAKIMI